MTRAPRVTHNSTYSLGRGPYSKAAGLGGFPVECLKKDGMAVLEWLVRLLNLSFDMVVIPIGLAWCLYSAPVQREG